MLIINYSPKMGQAIRDGEVEDFIKSAYSKSLEKKVGVYSISVATLSAVEEAQKLVINKTAPNKNIKFKFERRNVSISPQGKFSGFGYIVHPFMKLNEKFSAGSKLKLTKAFY